jgi:predicted alpha/beta-hydrolase family hydrolase
VLLLPGFQGRADQPILVHLAKRLEPLGFRCLRRAPPRLKLTPGLETFGAWLDGEVSAVRGRLIVVGRSFGGRLAVRLAARRPLEAVVLLGFPIRPAGKKRPLDEAALASLRCPTWIAQGTKDPLGPLRVLRQFAVTAEIFPVEGAGHAFGGQERVVLDAAAAWLDRTAR